MEYVIAVNDLNEGWVKLGASLGVRVVPESIQHSHELPGGPSTLSFVLKRDTRIAWQDLTPFTPVKCTLGGVDCWSGQIIQTPTNRGDGSEIQVTARGYWQHLNDNPIDKTWVVQDMSKWVDARTAPSQDLSPPGFGGGFGGTVENMGNAIVLRVPQGTVVPAQVQLGVYFDAGPNNTVKSLVLNWESSANDSSASLYVGNDTTVVQSGSMAEASLVSALNVASGGPTTYTFSTARRYAFIFFYRAAGATYAADLWVRLNNVSVFTDSADITSNASNLKASTVISEALAAGGDSDIINTSDTSLITTTSYSIPEYYTPGRRTVTEIISDVNAYHAYQVFMTSETQPRLTYRAVPTQPTYIVTDGDGYTFQDAGVNDGTEIYNKVYLRYQNGDGSTGEVSSTPTSDTTYPGRRGFTRALTIETRSRLSSGAAQQISDTYLALASYAPMKGSITIKGSIARYTDGARIPVGLIQVGDVLVVANERDQSTGTPGRRGIITAVTYNHDENSVSITLDSQRDYLDALLARLGG